MKSSKKLAVYLDHSSAKLFDFGIDAIEFKVIESEFTFQDRKAIFHKGESHLHNKEQHLQQKYYNEIGDAVLDFDNVLLFGPTDAKTELFNVLMESNRFGHIKLKVKTSDKLTENQQLAFVNNYFSELK